MSPRVSSSDSPLDDQIPLEHRAPLSAGLLEQMNAYWRAANYLSVGQIYLKGDPLLRRPLRRSTRSPLCAPRG